MTESRKRDYQGVTGHWSGTFKGAGGELLDLYLGKFEEDSRC
jgi:hypothetical protein